MVTLVQNVTIEDTDELSGGRNHARDEFQTARDGEVARLIKLWHEQGDQPVGKGAPTGRYVVPVADRVEMRKVIERAFLLASKGQPRKIKASWYKTKSNDGAVALKFAPEYAPDKPAEGNGQTATESAPPPADVETPAPPPEAQRRGFRRQ